MYFVYLIKQVMPKRVTFAGNLLVRNIALA